VPIPLQLTVAAATALTRQALPTPSVATYRLRPNSDSSCSSRAAPRASRHATPTISFPGKERRARAHCWLGHRPACSACRSRSCSYGSLSNTVACTYCGDLGICGCAYATACLEVPRCCGQSHCELCALRACLHRYRLAANRNRPAVLSSLPWLCQCSSQGVLSVQRLCTRQRCVWNVLVQHGPSCGVCCHLQLRLLSSDCHCGSNRLSHSGPDPP
jgi:hypothetical protein